MTRLDPTDVVESVSDADCRSILRETYRPRTVPELSEACDIPLSTVYRKVDRLTDRSLLETRVRINAEGRHPTQYLRTIGGLSVRFARDEATVAVVDRTGDPSVTDLETAGSTRDDGAARVDVEGPTPEEATDKRRERVVTVGFADGSDAPEESDDDR